MIRMRPPRFCAVILSVAILFPAAEALSQNGSAPTPASLTASQIVERLQHHERDQFQTLKHYRALRHYNVEYHGIATLEAKMEVEVTYDAASGKSFRIVSQSGSRILCDKVLKRAVESEREASQDKRATALSEANYRFQLAGTGMEGSRPAYILDVQPLTASKFLYRGKVWVDAADFAVMKVEAEPAKNPSFWITRTHISFVSANTGGFWLSVHSHSESKMRIGGTAALTIDYGKYETDPAVLTPVSGR